MPYLLPALLIGLFLLLRSLAGRGSRLRVQPPAWQADQPVPIEDDVTAEDGVATALLSTPDPIFAPAPDPIIETGQRGGTRYLLDRNADVRADRIAQIKQTIAGKGLCSPKG